MLMGQETLYSISPLIFCGVAGLGWAVGAGSSLCLGAEGCTAEAADAASSSLELVAVGALPPVSTGMGAKPKKKILHKILTVFHCYQEKLSNTYRPKTEKCTVHSNSSCSVLGVFRWWLAALGVWLATPFPHYYLDQQWYEHGGS